MGPRGPATSTGGAPEQPAGSGEGKMEEKGGSGGDAGGVICTDSSRKRRKPQETGSCSRFPAQPNRPFETF